jgi:hypothetical protein
MTIVKTTIAKAANKLIRVFILNYDTSLAARLTVSSQYIIGHPNATGGELQ